MAGPWEQFQEAGPWAKYAKKDGPPPIQGGVNPTEGQSFGTNLLQATGAGMTSVARAVGLGGAIGAPSREEAARLDAPLDATVGGKIGRVVGVGAPAALAIPFTPATLPGAAVAGGLTGAAITEGGVGERAQGAAWGAGGGALGQGVSNLLGKGYNYLRGLAADRAAAEAPRVASVATAREAGYVLPPNEIKRDLTNAVTNAWSGQIKTKQAASFKNQSNTNRLAAKALGLPEDQPLSIEAVKGVRQAASQAYEDVRNAGVIVADKRFKSDLANLTSPQENAADYFPGIANNVLKDVRETLDQPFFDASAGVDAMRLLRSRADDAFAKGDKSLGAAYKEASNALENLVERNLKDMPQGLDQFRTARKLMAKTYDVERSLVGETGNVSAAKLGAKAQKSPGRFSDELKQIADTHNAFPNALQTLRESPANYSAIDAGMGALSLGSGLMTGNPALAGMAAFNAARPVVRSGILSGPGQRFANADILPSPQNALLALTQLRRLQLPTAGAAGAITYGPGQ
jgi:hypothetical protein